MTQEAALAVLQKALFLIFKVSGPILLASLIIGLTISIIQAATQIHEQTLTFVPKLIAIALLLIVLAPWILTSTTDFMRDIFNLMSNI